VSSRLLRRPGLGPVAVLALGVIAGWLISSAKGGHTVPVGLLIGYGLVLGCGAGLSAIGLVLVYRSARIINFSQAAYGTNAVLLYLLLAGSEHWSYWLAFPVAVVATAAVAALVELLVIRKFSDGSRLVLTLVTVVVLQLLDGFGALLPRAFGYRPDQSGQPAALPATPPPAPFVHDRFNWAGAPLNGSQIELVVITVAMVLALSWFLRRSRLGLSVRAAAENAKRAGQLGISHGILSMTVWTIVAVLSAVGAITAATAQGTSLAQAAGGSQGYSILLMALAGAVLARLDNIPMAFAGAVALSIFEQGVQWAYANTAVVDVAQFVVILAALLVPRASRARTDEAFASSWAATQELRPIPQVMAGLAPVVTGQRWFRVVVVAVLAIYPFTVSSGDLDLGTTYAIFAIVGLSLVVLSGWAGQVSLGQFAFVAVGALVGGEIIGNSHLPFVLALIAGTLAAAAAAVLVGLPALRVKGLYLAVTTLSLAVALASMLGSGSFLANHLPNSVGRPSLLGLDMNADPRAYFYLCVICTGGALYLTKRLRRSRFGRLMIAIRDNEAMAQAYGQRVVRARLAAFALAGGMAGFAGVLFVCEQRALIPAAYGADNSVQMFLMAVLGGLGSPYAVLAGAVYFAVASTLFNSAVGALLTSGLGVLVVLLFFPAGLGAAMYRIRDAWLRRLAQRYRLLVPSLGGDRVKRGEEALVPIAPAASSEPVTVRYRIPSRIGELGASQALEKIWRY
jgi:branched-chain amino acid transport system permease protein